MNGQTENGKDETEDGGDEIEAGDNKTVSNQISSTYYRSSSDSGLLDPSFGKCRTWSMLV